MSNRTGASELKVGLFALLAITATVWASMATTDNPFEDKGYILNARMPSAQGLKLGSPMEMAGVRVGAVNGITIDEGRALIVLGVDPGFRIPYDSQIEVATRGILGDHLLKVRMGTSDTMLRDGDFIEAAKAAPSLADLQSALGTIAGDIQAITGSLRVMVGSTETQGRVSSILANVDGFTEQLSDIAAANRAEIGLIVDNIRILTEQLNQVTADVGPELSAEMVALREATETLKSGLVRVDSIATKIDEGEGTLGKLVNDDALIDSVGGTVDDIGELVRSVNRFQLELDYRLEAFVRHGPSGTSFGGAKSTIKVRVKPRPDYWYVIEIVDDPLGRFSLETEFVTEELTPGVTTAREVSTVKNTNQMQFSFQFARRWRAIVLRLGIKENTGGFGADLMLAKDRIQIHADLYDFRWAGFPNRTGVPNLRVGIDLSPLDHLYFTAGFENLINSAIDQQFNWYVGAGFYFTDNDIKWIMNAIPTGSL